MKRISYRACSCSSNIVGGRSGGGILGRVNDWAHARAELLIDLTPRALVQLLYIVWRANLTRLPI